MTSADSIERSSSLKRCPWCGTDPLYIAYHDLEWGVPLHDDRRLFEMLILECMQPGLSWITILRKRKAFERAFDNFDPEKIATYDRRRIGFLLTCDDIIRNRSKIEAAVKNAQAFLKVSLKHGSFDAYVWRFVDGRPCVNRRKHMSEVPSATPLSRRMSSELKTDGFVFIGPVICYSFMQAIGIVNDHLVDCFRHGQL